MVPMRHPADGRLHFSELKEHRLSAAHVKLACETAREVTRPMRVGYVCDRLVFSGAMGGGVVVYPGERRGNAWKDYQAEHAGECIVTAPEYADAVGRGRAGGCASSTSRAPKNSGSRSFDSSTWYADRPHNERQRSWHRRRLFRRRG
jgi:hypothetical protein